MDKNVRLSLETIKKLDSIKHPGQSYNGIIQEILEKLFKADAK